MVFVIGMVSVHLHKILVMDIFDTPQQDTSIFSSSNQMTKDEFIAEIVPIIQSILQKVFPGNAQKQKIRIHRDRISFAAPCCGDSAKDNYKKRGNIILEGKFRNLYKCFNCGTCMSVQKFLKTYGQSVSLNMATYIADNKVDFSAGSAFTSSGVASLLYDIDTIEQLSIDRDFFKNLLCLTECTDACFGRNYLVNRKQYSFEHFLYSVKSNKLFVLNLTPSEKIFGMQVRSFDKKTQAKYKTYGLQKIHEMILCDNVDVPDDINELSMLFNILTVDVSHPVTVVEGPMDSFLIKNCVALCGAGKHVEFPFCVRYMFDDDKAGREHSIEKIKEGMEVFLWEPFKKEIGMQAHGKVDFNDVVIWCDQNNVRIPSLDGFYSNDELDLISI